MSIFLSREFINVFANARFFTQVQVFKYLSISQSLSHSLAHEQGLKG